MTTVDAYALGMVLATVLAALMGGRGLWLAAGIMWLEFGLSNGAVLASGYLDPAEAFAFVHFIAAAVLLRDERHSAEVLIGGLYVGLLVVDMGYMIGLAATGSADTLRYLNWTAGGGWAQIAVLAAGSVSNGPGRRILRAPRTAWPMGGGIVLAGAALAASMAEAAAR